jgi:hypothetical protein
MWGIVHCTEHNLVVIIHKEADANKRLWALNKTSKLKTLISGLSINCCFRCVYFTGRWLRKFLWNLVDWKINYTKTRWEKRFREKTKGPHLPWTTLLTNEQQKDIRLTNISIRSKIDLAAFKWFFANLFL